MGGHSVECTELWGSQFGIYFEHTGKQWESFTDIKNNVVWFTFLNTQSVKNNILERPKNCYNASAMWEACLELGWDRERAGDGVWRGSLVQSNVAGKNCSGEQAPSTNSHRRSEQQCFLKSPSYWLSPVRPSWPLHSVPWWAHIFPLSSPLHANVI